MSSCATIQNRQQTNVPWCGKLSLRGGNKWGKFPYFFGAIDKILFNLHLVEVAGNHYCFHVWDWLDGRDDCCLGKEN